MKYLSLAGALALAGACCLPLGAQAQTASQRVSPVVEAAHTIATPAEISATVPPSFALQGFTLPDGCIALVDGCPPSVAPSPVFEPETDQYRPVINISFVAADDGLCGVGQVETVDGKTRIIPALAGVVETQKGERTFVSAVFYDAQERRSVGIDDSQAYRFTVMCRSDAGDTSWSTFYEAPQPEGT